MLKGTIKRINEKGFGFIKVDDGRDLFFHASALVNRSFASLQEGERCEFFEEFNDRAQKSRAVDVRCL